MDKTGSDQYSSAVSIKSLTVPCELPSRTIQGISILQKEDRDTLENRTHKLATGMLMVEHGILAALDSWVAGDGFGKAETRTYIQLARAAREWNATAAVIDYAGNKIAGLPPTPALHAEFTYVEFTLYGNKDQK